MPRGIPRSYRETDPALASDSDLKVPSTKAVRAYIATEGGGGGSVTLETPTGDVDGVNDEFVFSAPPIAVYRNGVMESRLGTVSTNTFTFDIPPDTGDDIEGLV